MFCWDANCPDILPSGAQVEGARAPNSALAPPLPQAWEAEVSWCGGGGAGQGAAGGGSAPTHFSYALAPLFFFFCSASVLIFHVSHLVTLIVLRIMNHFAT